MMISALVLLLVVALIVAAHFGFAAREWARIRLRHSAEIFPVLSSIESAEAAFRELLAEDASVGNFQCEQGSRSSERVYATGDVDIGNGSELCGIVAQGSVNLRSGARISDSLHAVGTVSLEGHSRVGRYMTSETGIRLAADTKATAIASPVITTPSGDLQPEHEVKPGMPEAPVDMTGGERFFSGDFKPATAVRIDSPLVIAGGCILPPRSAVNANVRVKGDAVIGAGTLMRGAVVCDGNLQVEDGCRFEQVLIAGGDIRVGARVTGTNPAGPVAMYAQGEIELGAGNFFAGRIYAAAGVGYAVPRAQPVSPQIRKARLAKGVFRILAAGALLSNGAAAQSDLPPVHVEMAGHVIAGQAVPSSNGGEITIEYRGWQFLRPILVYEALGMPEGKEQNASLLSFVNWTPKLFSTFGFSKSQVDPGAPALYPQWRADAKLLWKPVPTGWILGSGVITIRYRTSSADLLTITGVRYFRRWVLEADAYVNRTRPGDLWSGSGLVSAETGQRGRGQIRFRAGFGHEVYRMSVDNPAQFRYSSYSFDVQYRKWLRPRYGVILRAGDQEMSGIGRRFDGVFGFFFEL
jgi:YaiO family outer membrane protein